MVPTLSLVPLEVRFEFIPDHQEDEPINRISCLFVNYHHSLMLPSVILLVTGMNNGFILPHALFLYLLVY